MATPCRSAFDKDKDILSPVFPSNPRNLSASSDSAISIGAAGSRPSTSFVWAGIVSILFP